MNGIFLIINCIFFSIKSFFGKGKWNFKFWNNISPTVKIYSNINCFFEIGRKVIIERYGDIYVGNNASLKIGNNCYFNKNLTISCHDKIIIGDNCLFGPSVKIYDNNHKFKKNEGVKYELSKESISIGNNCWIASNVVILKGSRIGNNCVIGAGCVVNGDIPDNSIVKLSSDNYIIEEMRD